MRDILSEIIEKRKVDIEKRGVEFGFDIPKTRQRKIHPFIAEKGAILEVKRASPSKGDIAPGLDAGETALSYARAGAKAISCLTETNYFKGTLGDLMEVCGCMDSFERETGKNAPAVLRKDFLLSADEVDVAFRAGADAVLLIARILDRETMLSMAKKCEELGISALIEVRKDEDLEKLSYVLSKVDSKYIVAGVNSRDLRDFSIDMLIPSSMLGKIRKIDGNARVVFESGILSPKSAAFASSMGFNAFLMGEAAAKNPDKAAEFTRAFESASLDANGKAWLEYSSRALSSERTGKPFVKICGITNVDDASLACELGADFLGFIMWKKSGRNVEKERILEIRKALDEKKLSCRVKFVGVVVDLDSAEGKNALELCEDGVLDFVQVHTFDSARKFLSDSSLSSIPHYCAVNVASESDFEKLSELNRLGEPRIMIDAQSATGVGGTGKTIDPNLVKAVKKSYRLWLAGGISPDNVSEIVGEYSPELLDVSSSLEKEIGVKDHEKMKEFFSNLNKIWG